MEGRSIRFVCAWPPTIDSLLVGPANRTNPASALTLKISVIVDHQSHWIPANAFRLLGSRADRRGSRWYVEISPGIERSYGPEFYDLETHVADMDRHGVGAMLSSPGSAGDLSRLPLTTAAELAELYNLEAAQAQQELDGRFIGLAVVPLQDPDTALRLLNHALVDQGLRGLCVPPNLNERSIVNDELMPVYSRLAELGRPLVLHPTNRTVLASAYDALPPEFERIGWMFDTSAAALALIYGGVFDVAPGLVVLHPHLGGALPFVAARMSAVEDQQDPHRDRPARSVFHYFQENFFVDTVSGTPGSIEMAQRLYGAERVVFASDYPWLPREGALASVRQQLGAERAAVLEHTELPGLR